jgi:hypothetical protein
MPARHESPLIANFWKLKRAWPLLNNFLSAPSKSKSPTLFSARSSKQRFGENKGAAHYRELAAELIRLKVDLIVVTTTATALVAKNATSTVPIVMTNPGDPVGAGLVTSLARPGGNITGYRV